MLNMDDSRTDRKSMDSILHYHSFCDLKKSGEKKQEKQQHQAP